MQYHYVLFTTITCPKCPSFKDFVKKNLSFAGEILDNNSPSFGARVAEAKVHSAPTLLIYDQDEKEVFRTDDVDELQMWLEKQKN